MTPSILVLVAGAFFVGGAISFYQQRKPLWSIVLIALIAAALIGYGAYSWSVSV
ncbi:hypothetical protein KVA01_18070 [Kocuria varians]|uniref:Amidotransferase n=1 Tax=Kocuria varians TaxID=1272 RepID=A0A4Y4D5R4_KOCVA|nr:hypothetical protein [Kocuria varians]GEC99652.1 hypothetical protein KVA01_18070 [Kocuria varians]